MTTKTCPFCKKEYASDATLERHIGKVHTPELLEIRDRSQSEVHAPASVTPVPLPEAHSLPVLPERGQVKGSTFERIKAKIEDQIEIESLFNMLDRLRSGDQDMSEELQKAKAEALQELEAKQKYDQALIEKGKQEAKKELREPGEEEELDPWEKVINVLGQYGVTPQMALEYIQKTAQGGGANGQQVGSVPQGDGAIVV
jgi:hypothetical protein